MHDHSNPVPWADWLRNRPDDVRRPDQMIVALGQAWRCLLCEQPVAPATRAEHHLQHMLDLNEYLAGAKTDGPATDSLRRAADRRARRQEALDRAAALGEDPYKTLIVKVDPKTGHRVRHRRLRHPRQETIGQVRDLLGRGVSPKAIATKLDKSDNYIGRIIREIRAETAPKAARNPANHAASSGLSSPTEGAVPPAVNRG